VATTGEQAIGGFLRSLLISELEANRPAFQPAATARLPHHGLPQPDASRAFETADRAMICWTLGIRAPHRGGNVLAAGVGMEDSARDTAHVLL
jgi:hypothetical protein